MSVNWLKSWQDLEKDFMQFLARHLDDMPFDYEINISKGTLKLVYSNLPGDAGQKVVLEFLHHHGFDKVALEVAPADEPQVGTDA